MKDNLYAKACTEVLEILSHFSEEDFSKIPSDKIEFFEKNKDKDYEYKIDPDVDLSKQYISDEANAIIVGLYKEYFATEHQKNVIDDILKHNQVLEDREKSVKYNPDDLFKDKEEIKFDNNVEDEYDAITDLIERKESFLEKLKRFIFKIFHIEEKQKNKKE